MDIEASARRRIQSLLEEANQGNLTKADNDHGQVQEAKRRKCAGWLTSAQNLVSRLCPGPDEAYRTAVDRAVGHGANYVACDQVGSVVAVLGSLLQDIDAGMLSSIADRARVEVFDDFLDHGIVFLKQGRVQESGVIAGVVFEDVVRRAHRKLVGPDAGIQLDEIISALVKAGALSDTKAKRARAAAHVRTKATHAQWDQFDGKDVDAAIGITKELASALLDS